MNKISLREGEDLNRLLDSLETGPAEIDLCGRTVKGQTVIRRGDVLLRNGTFTGDLGAYEILSDGYKRGTFRSYTLFIDADRVRLENVSVLNESGPDHGQAIALMIGGDHFEAENCRISSYQDTLFLGPLPEKEYEARGFIGPLQDRERRMTHSRFRRCRIEGSVDFIFGGGSAFFEECEIVSRNIGEEINGYVTAPSTPENERYGFLFGNCVFSSEEGMDETVYLGRPWRDHAKCLIADSKIGKHIRREGYHDWNKTQARTTSEFKEYHNEDLGPAERVNWLKQVTEEDLEYTGGEKI